MRKKIREIMMSDVYTKSLLTIIAVALCAITVKLYVPAANRLGPNIGGPTLSDMFSAKEIQNESRRAAAIRKVSRDAPIVFVGGGNVDVSGEVSIHGPVEINR
jgi:hypothetical protein